MIITKLILEDYKRLRLSRIKRVSLNTEHSKTQLIIGSNGSGKSSLLNELFPNAPVKSSFGNQGYKELCLTDGGIEYKLIYTPGNGHLFYRNNENLNKNGNNDVQRELIEKYFRINSDIHTILKCSLQICEMLPSIRKKLLLGLNPIDISIFIEKYKKVHKDVVAYGNNLDMLYKRHKQLSDQKLPDDQFQGLLAKRDELANQEKLLLVWITKVTDLLSQYQVANVDCDLSEVRSKIIGIYRELPRFSQVKRKSYNEQLTEYSTKISMIESELVGIDDSLAELVATLNKYEIKKQELTEKGTDVADELSQQQTKLKSFHFDNDFIQIPENQLSSCAAVINPIRDLVLSICDVDYKNIISREALTQQHRQLVTYQADISSLNNELASLNKRHDDLKSSTKTYQIPTTCIKDTCELYTAYDKHHASKLKELTEIETNRNKVETKLNEIKANYAAISESYNIQTRLWELIDKVIRTIDQVPSLSRQFPASFIIERIQKSPLDLVNDITRYITDSEAYIEYQKLLNRILELERLNQVIESKKQLSSDVLNEEIVKYTAKLVQTRKLREDKASALQKLSNKIIHLQEFSNVKNSVIELNDTVVNYEANVRNNAEMEYLSKLNTILNNILNSIRSELVDVIRICKDQELLLARLTNEVDSIVAELKPKYDKAKQTEIALVDLPIIYTRSFVNDLINTTNYFIGQVMTYPMQLIPIKDSDPLDFSFPITLDGEVTTKDISECSDGQKAIINLAFNLALIIELKYNDYPISIDEVDRALDTTHSIRLTHMLNSLVEKGVVSQMFVINHHQSMIEGINGNVTVLNGDNIILPEVYNDHAELIYY